MVVSVAECLKLFFFFCFFLIGVSLMNSVVAVSVVQQNDSVTHALIFILFQILTIL